MTTPALYPPAGLFSHPFAFAPVRPLGHVERGFMWLIGFSSGFVVIEPAPYEFILAVAAVLFFAGGMSMRAAHLPLLILLSLCNIGYLIGLTPVASENGTVMWTAVSCFMAATSLFFALAMGEDTERRLDLLLKGYVAVAVVVSLIGIAAYAHVMPESDMFLFAQRARSTFKDPNVLGAFLVVPAVLTLQRMMLGRLRDILAGGVMTLVIAIALLLAFSRGAWAAAGAAVVLSLLMSFLVSTSPRERLKIVVIAAASAAMVAVVIIAVISIPQVRDLFQDRANLIQSYDAGRFGRFGRHILGAEVAIEHPFGIGPLQFSKIFPEDPHNSILDAFMAGGWLSGAAWFALIIVTLVAGLHGIFVDAPWRRTYIAIYASFVALTAESYIIDVEHWRHFFLLIGLVWGLLIAGSRGPGLAKVTRVTPAA